MAEESEKSETLTPEQVEVLNEEFQCYTRVAKPLIATLMRPKDVEVSNELLRKCQAMYKSENAEVKKATNEFFKYFLHILLWNTNHQPRQLYCEWYKNNVKTPSSNWLEENKSFMSTKTLDNGTVLIYVAIANDPAAGWQENGLRYLHQATKPKVT